MELFLLWFGIACVTAIIGAGKGRSGLGWLILGALFSVFALLVVICIPSPARTVVGAPNPSTHVKCPECRELVFADATKCKHCGTKLVPTTIADPISGAEKFGRWLGAAAKRK